MLRARRDRGERPQLAAFAAVHADCAAMTSDNPRTEDPQAIIADILSGGVRADLVEACRRTAIRKTLSLAAPGDIVLIAGKGHEDYQIVATEKRHFSDQEEVRAFWRETGAPEPPLFIPWLTARTCVCSGFEWTSTVR